MRGEGDVLILNDKFPKDLNPIWPVKRLRIAMVSGEAGCCPGIDWSTADDSSWLDFPILFVEEDDYSLQMSEKFHSISFALAAIAILGQHPEYLNSLSPDKT